MQPRDAFVRILSCGSPERRTKQGIKLATMQKLRTICSWPGCGKSVFLPDRYCDKHKTIKEEQKARAQLFYERRRGSSSSRGYNYKWTKFRREYLRLHPVCACCGRLATEIDHIVPFKSDKTKIFELTNLQPLCHECHSRKTAKESGRMLR